MTSERQLRRLQGINRAKAEGKYKGRPIDADLHARIKLCLDVGMSIRNTATVCQCAKSTVQRVQSAAALEREL